MLFSEFIADLENCDSGLPVLLASRTNADESLADNCAQLRAFGAILVDGAGTDVDIRPTSGDVRLNVGEVLEIGGRGYCIVPLEQRLSHGGRQCPLVTKFAAR